MSRREHAPTRRLRGTGFGSLWLSAGSSNLADGVLLAGLPVLATTVTTSPALISGVAVALFLPTALTALPAGVVADRFDRRRVLLAANLARVAGLLVVLALVAVGQLTLAAIYLAAVVCGGTELFADATAQTAVPSLVGPDRLEPANARMVATQTVANNALGGPIGAVLATAGAGALLGVPVLLYLAAGIAAARLRMPAPAPADRSGRWARQTREEIVEGLSHLRHEPVLGPLAVAACLSNLGNVAFGAVAVLYVLGPLQLSEVAYGWLAVAVAGGGLLGSLVSTRLIARLGRAVALKAAFAAATLGYALLAAWPEPIVAYSTVAVLGAAGLLTNVAARSVRQLRTPDRLLGRVTASSAALGLAATPIGAALGGLVAEVTSVLGAAWLAAGVNLAALALLRPLTRERVDEGHLATAVA